MISPRLEALVDLRERGGAEAEELSELDRILKNADFREDRKENRQAAKLLRDLVEAHVLGHVPKDPPQDVAVRLAQMLSWYSLHEGAQDPVQILYQPGVSRLLISRTNPRLFVSHQHRDKPVAGALMSMLQSAFEISEADARCTSVPPFRLPVGTNTPDRLRKEIRTAQVVLGLIAPDTKESAFVGFELGAAWSHACKTYPLLIHGASVADIPSPIRDLNALTLANPDDCQELLDALEESTTFPRRRGVAGDVSEKVHRLAALAGAL